MAVKQKDTVLSIASDPVKFFVKQMPNKDEARVTSASQVILDYFVFAAVKPLFGDNPSASAVLRDASKLPGTYANIQAGNTVAGTGRPYSEGDLWSGSIKVACKTGILVPYYVFFEKEGFEFVARGANFVCDIPSRYIALANEDKYRTENIQKSTQKDFSLFIHNTVTKVIEDHPDISRESEMFLFQNYTASQTEGMSDVGKRKYWEYIQKEVVQTIDRHSDDDLMKADLVKNPCLTT